MLPVDDAPSGHFGALVKQSVEEQAEEEEELTDAQSLVAKCVFLGFLKPLKP